MRASEDAATATLRSTGPSLVEDSTPAVTSAESWLTGGMGPTKDVSGVC